MKSSKLLTRGLLVGLVTAATCTAGFAQAEKGGLYVYHTSATGGCPGLDWHITVEPDSSLVGFVAWNQMKHMARLAGTISKDRTFKMQAKEVGGSGRVATVTGTAAGDYISASIAGSGTACDNKVLQIPRFAGGLGGGGG